MIRSIKTPRRLQGKKESIGGWGLETREEGVEKGREVRT